MTATTSRRDAAALGGPIAGLAFVSGVGAGLARATSPYPRPGSTPTQIQAYFQGSAGAARTSIAGQLASATALVAFTSSVMRLAGRAGRGRFAMQAAAVAGGGLAAAALATSAVTSATLTGARRRDDASTVRLHRRVFVAGGPVHGAAFGVLVGVLALAGRRTGDLPRPLTTAALASSAVGLLSPVALVVEAAVWAIPAGRFSGLIVSGVAGVQLAGRSRLRG